MAWTCFARAVSALRRSAELGACSNDYYCINLPPATQTIRFSSAVPHNENGLYKDVAHSEESFENATYASMPRILTHPVVLASLLVGPLVIAQPVTSNGTLAQVAANQSSDEIPGLEPCTDPPCGALCPPRDRACLSAAASIAATCSPQWSTWSMRANGAISTPTGQGWSTYIKTEGIGPTTSTGYTLMYTTFSAASGAVGRYNSTGDVTFTPVYALGTPLTKPVTSTFPDNREYFTRTIGPKPKCKYTTAFLKTFTDCGQCTLTGGTVDLYFWPPSTAAAGGNVTATGSPRSTVVDGTTMISPSAYIHLRTVYASDQCSQVGRRYTSKMLAMNPEDITTQIHVGGKAGGSDANRYTALNYADLVGLPPMSAYELQPSCVVFGCPTIYPSSHWDPTLEVPTQLRSMDPAWKSCAVGLDGLYDPPIPLTPQAVMAMPTTRVPASYAATSTVVSAHATKTLATPARSNPLGPVMETSIGSVASVIASALRETEAGGTPVATGRSVAYGSLGSTISVLQDPSSRTTGAHDSKPKLSSTLESWYPATPSLEASPTVTGAAWSVVQPSLTADSPSAASLTQLEASRAPVLASDGQNSATMSSPGLSVPSAMARSSSLHSAIPAQGSAMTVGPVTASVDASGRYVLDGVTLGPESGVVIVNQKTSLTVAMVTSAGSSMLEVGSVTTINLAATKTGSDCSPTLSPANASLGTGFSLDPLSSSGDTAQTASGPDLPAVTVAAVTSSSDGLEEQAPSSQSAATPASSRATRTVAASRCLTALAWLLVMLW